MKWGGRGGVGGRMKWEREEGRCGWEDEVEREGRVWVGG